MGLANLAVIIAKLMEHGKSPQTPIAVIGSGTTGQQKSIFGTLTDIVEKSSRVQAPATIVIGDVVLLADKLQWFVGEKEHQLSYGGAEEREPARA